MKSVMLIIEHTTAEGIGLKLRDTRPLGMTSGQDSDIRYDK
jgi:hypothetical protein